MATGPISVGRTPITLPSRTDTRKSQKRGLQPAEYSPLLLNQELDYVHERLNLVVREDPALTDLSGSATLSDVITRLNSITETLRNAGLLKRS